ncbi:hypothetical protein Lal_00036729 [Lupinus albus]|nr:hypothetical protein Lal_00036729 [Lupinus albus]
MEVETRVGLAIYNLYSYGLHFNLARDPYYVNLYLFDANHNLSGFLPPEYNALRTTFLQQEKSNVERLLKPIKSTWKSTRVSKISDGWTDSQRRRLINFMATCNTPNLSSLRIGNNPEEWDILQDSRLSERTSPKREDQCFEIRNFGSLARTRNGSLEREEACWDCEILA